MFNTLAKLGKFEGDNPVSALTKLRVPESEIFFLRSEQIAPLLREIDALDYDAGVMARICLATGHDGRSGKSASLSDCAV
ncbi:integrase [Haemophilus parahaemolyticus]|uniref:Integrase n=1 Tax=Haemophilus parahaemolyticus TaxID=735 RepID=A0A377I291_HAEPH|nr:integrase [Haemophilus parahaemolyticus]